MFAANGSGGAIACCGASRKGSQIGLVNTARAVTTEPSGRTVPFPFVSALGPVSESGAPVTGLTAWPEGEALGRRYYGLSGLAMGPDPFDEGGGDFPATTYPTLPVLPSIYPTTFPKVPGMPALPGSPPFVERGPSTLQTILGNVKGWLTTVPSIVSAAKGSPYYNPAQLGGQQTVYGQPVGGVPGTGGVGQAGATAGRAIGNLGDAFAQIVYQHPYLVLGLGAGLVLWFMNPPRRR